MSLTVEPQLTFQCEASNDDRYENDEHNLKEDTKAITGNSGDLQSISSEHALVGEPVILHFAVTSAKVIRLTSARKSHARPTPWHRLWCRWTAGSLSAL